MFSDKWIKRERNIGQREVKVKESKSEDRQKWKKEKERKKNHFVTFI